MSDKRSSQLIGYGITVVIASVAMVGILTATAAPALTDTDDLARIQQVKANMCTVQLAFEDFAVQSDGYYPTSNTDVTMHGQTVKDLCPDVDGDGAGDWPTNPFTGLETVFSWGADPCTQGDLGSKPATAACYRIKGCGMGGNLILYELANCGPRRPARQME